jgi:Lyzozyme M1 (1,4-beta-N-acetylmuramidase)
MLDFFKKLKTNNKGMIIIGAIGGVVLIAGIALIIGVSLKENNAKEVKSNQVVASKTPSPTPVVTNAVTVPVSPTVTVTPTPTVAPTKKPTPKPKVKKAPVKKVKVPPVKVAPVNDKADPQKVQKTGEVITVSKPAVTDTSNSGTLNGIDVSKWQGVIDWKKVKDSGVQFAFIRVGYRTEADGTMYEDPYARYNMEQAQANGIKIGAYFFSTAVNTQEALEEATWVANFIAPYTISYPIVYDCEGYNDAGSRQYGLGISARTDNAIAFLDCINSYGYTPMFYASKNALEKNSQWNAELLSSKYKIWVAQYPSTYTSSSKTSYTGTYSIWQYTSKGKVNGISGYVDLDISYSANDVPAKDGQVQTDPSLINFTTVNETVTAKTVTNLRILPSTASGSTIAVVLKKGDTANRIGVGDNGWSKVVYQGQTLYAVSSYLTVVSVNKTPTPTTTPTPTPTPIPIVFTEVDEQVTAKVETALYTEPKIATSGTVTTKLKNGDIAKRTGTSTSDLGWSRLVVDGKTYYAKSTDLTTDLNYKPSITPTPSPTPTATSTPTPTPAPVQ